MSNKSFRPLGLGKKKLHSRFPSISLVWLNKGTKAQQLMYCHLSPTQWKHTFFQVSWLCINEGIVKRERRSEFMVLSSICQFFSYHPTVLCLLENLLQSLVNGNLKNIYIFIILSYWSSSTIFIQILGMSYFPILSSSFSSPQMQTWVGKGPSLIISHYFPSSFSMFLLCGALPVLTKAKRKKRGRYFDGYCVSAAQWHHSKLCWTLPVAKDHTM